jgi:hypothetical protein
VREFAIVVAVVAAFGVTLYGGGQALGVWELPTPSKTANVEKSSAWTVHRGPGFTIELPATWRALGAAETWDTKEFRRRNPKVARFMEIAAEGRNPNNKLTAFDLSAAARRSARRDLFVTNMNVIKAPTPLTRGQMWRRSLDTLRDLPDRVGRLQVARTRIAEQPALRVQMRLRIRTALGPVVLSSLQWSVIAGGYHYVLSYATHERSAARYQSVFARSAASFRVRDATSVNAADGTASFVRRADAICAKHRLPADSGSGAKRMHALAEVFSAQIRQLAALSPPRAAAERYARMLALARRLVAAIEDAAAALERGDAAAAAAAQKRGQRYAERASNIARNLKMFVCAA